MDSEEAVQFKHWMGSDEVDFNMSRPTYPMHYDRNFNFRNDRSFYLGLLLFLGFMTYANRKYYYERDRMTRTERIGNIENLPAHHFNNRGGVLVQKQFAGFEKYYQNSEAMMDWYKMAYPKNFKAKE